MGVEAVVVDLDDGNGDVGAVIGDTPKVGQQIRENKAHLDGAASPL